MCIINFFYIIMYIIIPYYKYSVSSLGVVILFEFGHIICHGCD